MISELSPVSPREYRLIGYSAGTGVDRFFVRKSGTTLGQKGVLLCLRCGLRNNRELALPDLTKGNPIVAGGGQINFRLEMIENG